ncbi:putative transporter/permease protein [Cardiosporidium cionae]|uniref:Transporter/permease protein n=1 Tax=Cardiosporidium cionae TaxID=476202 RepID=A0ABQ7JA88_9APIC|nr:putative transporter/permease protein [Cardiosporidium cionae]|eukprot:KAF8820902.1 putative transporter/permease protein [Cardiosporidium cionae]
MGNSDVIKFNGAAHSSTFLILLPHYYSMTLVGLIPTEKKLSECNWRRGFFVSFLDILNQLLKKGGLLMAGAAVYTVVDSSSIVWTAVWSRLLLKRHLSFSQWFSLFLISLGLSFKAFQLNFSLHDEEFIGVLLILTASILMGLTFVLNEKYMEDANPTEGPNLVCMMGICCSILLTMWTFGWTIPRFDALILKNIALRNGDKKVILMSFFGLLVSGWLHSGTFWYIMKKIGAVSTGVLKGMKVATVFLLSHYFFCELQPSQCLNVWTGLSTTVCVIGVISYTYATTYEKKQLATEEETAPLLKN